jgi:hypothetical protein
MKPLQEIYTILNTVFGKYSTLYSPFVLSDDFEKLTFKGDSYYDPVMFCLTLNNFQLLEMTYQTYGETDYVTITGGNVEAFRALNNMVPFPADSRQLEPLLIEMGYERTPQTGPIVLDNSIVSRADWNRYWKSKGKIGPESGFDIPTYAEFMTHLNSIDEK